jgi:hypothetical protein
MKRLVLLALFATFNIAATSPRERVTEGDSLGISVGEVPPPAGSEDKEVTETTDETAEVPADEVMPQESETPKFTPLNPKWSAPNFSKQDSALGWTPEAFAVPPGMAERVQFRRDT